MTLVLGGQQLLYRNVACPFLQRFDAFDHLIGVLSALTFLWRQARNGAAVTRDAHGLPSFHLIKNLRQMRFRVGSLDITHGSYFDQSF